jgi:hypothetical protein
MLRWTQHCDATHGFSRRTFLQVGGLSLWGLSTPRWLRGLAERNQAQAAPSTPRKAARCILLWTDGGMSNVDTLDMKPDAPAEYRGEFRPVASDVPGMDVCEYLPHMARTMRRVCLLKTIAHTESGDHVAATHYMLTGHPQRPDPTGQPAGATIHPAFGAVVSRQRGWTNDLPPNIQIAGKIYYAGAGYLGSAYDPLVIASDPNAADFRVEDVSIPQPIGLPRTRRRHQMLAQLDSWQRNMDREGGELLERNEFYRQAFELITSPAAKRAFDLNAEPANLRDRYGRTREGQAALLARRLVEAGVPFVTIGSGGWDTHDNNFNRLKKPLLPTLDQAWSALLEDLDERGLLDQTLVVCAGEFGRTPRVNGAAGRDHYAPCNVIGLSGAGVAMGKVIGATDARCEQVVGRSHSTMDYAATLYRLLGVDDSIEYPAEDGRPIRLNNGGRPISEVFA